MGRENQKAGFRVVIVLWKGSSLKPPTNPRFFVSQRIEQNIGKATVKGAALVKARRTLHRVGADTSKPVTLQLLFLGPEGKSSSPRA